MAHQWIRPLWHGSRKSSCVSCSPMYQRVWCAWNCWEPLLCRVRLSGFWLLVPLIHCYRRCPPLPLLGWRAIVTKSHQCHPLRVWRWRSLGEWSRWIRRRGQRTRQCGSGYWSKRRQSCCKKLASKNNDTVYWLILAFRKFMDKQQSSNVTEPSNLSLDTPKCD